MPSLLATKSVKRTMAPLARAEVWLSLACALVLVGAALYWKTRPATVESQAGNPGPPSPAAACATPDQAFCATQAVFARYVAERDFSGVLEQQVRTGQGFAVEEGASEVLFANRNQYIAYLRRYFAQNGPFRFARDDSAAGKVAMVFVGQGAHTLTLTFEPDGSGWKLVALQTT